MTKARSIPKGAARLAVEAALMRATKDFPLTAVDVAAETGDSIDVVRTHIGNCVNCGLAYNTNAGQRGYGLYVWGQPAKLPAVERDPIMQAPVYVPPKPFYARPEGQLAYLIPSLGDTERKRPILVGASLA